jgi:hypothetical protein
LLKLADDQQQARTGRFAGQPVRDHVTDRLTPTPDGPARSSSASRSLPGRATTVIHRSLPGS